MVLVLLVTASPSPTWLRFGLQSPAQAAHQDTDSRRVSAPVSGTCSAEGIPTHSLLRFLGQPTAGRGSAALPHTAVSSGLGSHRGAPRRTDALAVPLLPRTHEDPRISHRPPDPLGGTPSGGHCWHFVEHSESEPIRRADWRPPRSVCSYAGLSRFHAFPRSSRPTLPAGSGPKIRLPQSCTPGAPPNHQPPTAIENP
jgi:hypothetical protein